MLFMGWHDGPMTKRQTVRRTSGQALVARVLAEMRSQGLAPDGRETELLTLAETLENRRAELEASIAEDGVRVKMEGGRVLLNPAVAEARQTATALARVLQGVQMEPGPMKNPAKQAAAQSRWRQHNAAKAASAEH
jgi:hypothetical protein